MREARLWPETGSMTKPDSAETATATTTTTDSRQRTHRRFGLGALIAAAAAGLTLGASIALLGGWALLVGANPLGDEWQCVEGEAPADHRSGGSACFEEGRKLPKGYTWDPLGNRPMSYNCDKDGWVEIEHERKGEFECIAEGTAVPEGWRVVAD